jgi:hypothetical protein
MLFENSVLLGDSTNGATCYLPNWPPLDDLMRRTVYHGDNDYGNDKIKLKSEPLNLQLSEQMTTFVWQKICNPTFYQTFLPRKESARNET